MATLIDKVYSLNIGVQGENIARPIELDMTEWVAAYPDASFYVLFRPYNESEAVPMLSTFEDNILTWTPTLSATAVSGVGYTEVRALDPETGLIRKSRIIPTSVENSVTGADENPPQPYTDWVNRVLEAGSDAVKGAAAVAAVSQGEEVAFEIDADGHLNIVYTESGEPQTLDLGPVDAYAIAVVEGYTGTREEWVQAMADAEANGLKAEGYAIGKQNGVAVESGEYYQNNAKYYSEQAQSAKEDAEAAQTAAETAQTAAETAQASAEASAAEAAQYTSTAVHTWLENNIDPATGYALDRTLTEPLEAAPADMVGDLKSAIEYNLSELNCYNLFDGISKTNRTAHNVEWEWNGEYVHVSGQANALENFSVYQNATALPKGFEAGKTYRVLHSPSVVLTKIYDYDGSTSVELFNSKLPGSFTIPNDCTGLLFRLVVPNGKAVDETFAPTIIDAETMPNKEIVSAIGEIYPIKGQINSVYSSCDDILAYGTYFCSQANQPANWAFPDKAGWLVVIPMVDNQSGTDVVQIAIRYSPTAKDNNMLLRTKKSGAWISAGWETINESYNLDRVEDALYKLNALDILKWSTGTSGTSNGVTYTKNNDNSWTIDGETSSSASFRNILDYHAGFPVSIVPGRKYKSVLSQESTTTLQVFYYYEGGTSEGFTLAKEDVFEIPTNVIGIIIRFRVPPNTTVNNETVSISIVAVPEWQGEQIIVNQTVHNDTFNNEYNISVSPQITTDDNGWLQPVDTESEDETGKTDMTSAIMAMLNSTGYCHLAPGIYYVSGNIDMPQGSTIEGCGYDTDVRLLSSVAEGYVFKMEKYNTIKDLKVSGSYTPLPYNQFTAERGTRHGIIFNSRYAEGTSETEFCTLQNVYALNFTGCGIKCYNTSIATHRGLYASQVDVKRCQTGVFVDFHSEFNKFMQLNTRYCYIGCENDGGNNTFIGCTFHATNTGFIIDNSLNDKNNNAHGSVIGCTFCHIGSNEGIGIAVKGSANGFVFSGCQIWYCSVYIQNSYGIVFSDIEFGRGVPLDGQTAKGATITVDGGGTVMFIGSVFMNDISYPPTITISNNNNVKFSGCYGSHSGNEITAI